MRRVGLLIFLAGGLGAGRAAAQTKTGTTIGQFVAIEPSARIAAMGNAGVGLQDDIQAVYYNPASLAPMDHAAVQLTHAFWFADIAFDYVAAAVPVRGWGTFFGGVTALSSGDMDVRTVEQPLGTGERYSVSDLQISLGFGRQITDRFGAGAQLNYVTETIWHSTMRVTTFNIGTTYRIADNGLALGASLTNFGTKASFSGRDLAIQYDNDPTRYGDNGALPADAATGDFPVPILFRVGVAYPRRLSDQSRMLVAVDAFHPSDNTESMSAGWEWTWKEAFSLRAGYQNLYQQDSELGLTAGVGIQGGSGDRRFQFDYAWAYHATLSETHRITFGLRL